MSITTASLAPEPMPRRADEEKLHRSVVAYLRLALPADAEFYHVPNGGLRHRRVAEKLVPLGLKAGIPDLAIVWRGRALFIELKAAKGVLSEHQRQMHRKLVYCGAEVLVCRTPECVENGLRELGVPLKASVV